MPGQVLIGYRRDGNKYQADLTDRLKSMQDVAALFGVRKGISKAAPDFKLRHDRPPRFLVPKLLCDYSPRAFGLRVEALLMEGLRTSGMLEALT